MCFFQSDNYVDLLQGIPGAEPFIFAYSKPGGEGNFKVSGILYYSTSRLKKIFTTRILITEEPVNIEACIAQLRNRSDWQFRDQTSESAIYTEVRFLTPPSDMDKARLLPYSEVQNNLNILVDTSQSAQVLFSKLSDSKKRQVKSSYKSGAFVRPAETEDEVKQFYDIVRDPYRTRVKKPLIPEEIFLRFFRNRKSGVVLLAIYREKIIGGMLCPYVREKALYEWYIAGNDTIWKEHKVYPSVLLTWEAIKYASDNGFAQFNFMGAGVAGQPYGARDFKIQFGGILVEAPRFLFIHKPILYNLGKAAIKLGFGS